MAAERALPSRAMKFAITSSETGALKPEAVTWHGDYGLWRRRRVAGAVRYDLVQRAGDRLRVFYRSRGFLDANVDLADARLKGQKLTVAQRDDYTLNLMRAVEEYRGGLETAGFREVSVTPTHAAADGMWSAIIRAVRA